MKTQAEQNMATIESLNDLNREKAKQMLSGYLEIREVFIKEFEEMKLEADEDITEILI